MCRSIVRQSGRAAEHCAHHCRRSGLWSVVEGGCLTRPNRNKFLLRYFNNFYQSRIAIAGDLCSYGRAWCGRKRLMNFQMHNLYLSLSVIVMVLCVSTVCTWSSITRMQRCRHVGRRGCPLSAVLRGRHSVHAGTRRPAHRPFTHSIGHDRRIPCVARRRHRRIAQGRVRHILRLMITNHPDGLFNVSQPIDSWI